MFAEAAFNAHSVVVVGTICGAVQLNSTVTFRGMRNGWCSSTVTFLASTIFGEVAFKLHISFRGWYNIWCSSTVTFGGKGNIR